MSTVGRPVAVPFAWAESLRTFGVTGTNGKTSTCAFIRSCLREAGRDVVSVGTTGAFINETEVPKGKSFADFVALMRQGTEAGCTDVVAETTSFGLQIGYAKKWRFDVGTFTNLSADHLKTHKTWENYLAAKAQLFLHLGPGCPMILNSGDVHSTYLDRATPADVLRFWFRVASRGPAHHAADLEAVTTRVDPDGTRIELGPSPLAQRLGGALQIRMIGDIFAENALAAAATCLAVELDPDAIRRGLAKCPVVPGRFEILGRDPIVAVDYAHTADALEHTCRTARTLARGRVIVVFGAGGGATPDKRAPMGETVARGADLAVITTDNPRHEDPAAIATMIEAGVRRVAGADSVTVLDRRGAIEHALEVAQPADVVVVAGMGHERGQKIKGEVIPFSDRDEVRRLVGESQT